MSSKSLFPEFVQSFSRRASIPGIDYAASQRKNAEVLTLLGEHIERYERLRAP